MLLRPYTPKDFSAIATLYRDAVEGLGSAAYTPEQVAVWAAFSEDTPAFQARMAQGFALIAEIDGEPAAFCHLHPVDYVSFLYTATRFARRGCATAVYAGIERWAREQGQQRLRTDASKLARPFFEGQGFVVVTVEHVDRHGVSFERYQMEKSLSD